MSYVYTLIYKNHEIIHNTSVDHLYLSTFYNITLPQTKIIFLFVSFHLLFLNFIYP